MTRRALLVVALVLVASGTQAQRRPSVAVRVAVEGLPIRGGFV